MPSRTPSGGRKAAVLRTKTAEVGRRGGGLERVVSKIFAGSGVRPVELPAALRE